MSKTWTCALCDQTGSADAESILAHMVKEHPGRSLTEALDDEMKAAIARTLYCEFDAHCTERATYLGSRGWVYCDIHAPERAGYERVRKLTDNERERLIAGDAISWEG